MRLLNQRRCRITLLVGLLLLASAPGAQAIPVLRFIVDGVVTNCSENNPCDALPGLGVVQSTVNLAGVSVTSTTGTTKPMLDQPQLDLNALHVQFGAGIHDIVMLFSDTDFTDGAGSFSLDFVGSISNPAGTTVSASLYFDNAGVGNNALFCGGLGDNCAANGSLIGTIGPFGDLAFSDTATVPGGLSTPYSLTQVIRLHTTGAGVFSADFLVEATPAEGTPAVPEPSTAFLLANGLLATVIALRRKQRV
jgi:hypothetical protein